MRLEQLEKWIAPLKRRVMQSISRAVINTINDAGGIQKLQVALLADETHSNVDRIQQYGFTSSPLPGAEGVFVAVGGSREHGVIIALDDRRYRLKNLAPGEVALYTDEGDKIHFKRGGLIEVTASSKVQVNAPEVEINAADTAIVNTAEATVNATTKALVTSPQIELVAPTGIVATTPLFSISGLLSAAGLAVGGGAPVSGEASIAGPLKVTGPVEATGDVQDGTGTMQAMRDVYNTHTHPETGTTTDAPNESM